jgi:hypothetical protein
MPVLPAPYSTIILSALLLLTIGMAFYAWWLSSVGSRKRRELVDWARDHRPEAWLAIPPTAQVNLSGGVNYLRHNDLAEDTEFIERCQEVDGYRVAKLAVLAVVIFDIGLVLAGTYYWGWV